MLRIRTTIGTERVFTLFDNNKWVTFATGLQYKEASSLQEAGQNHLMAARALYIKRLENEHRMKNADKYLPMPGETWNAK